MFQGIFHDRHLLFQDASSRNDNKTARRDVSRSDESEGLPDQSPGSVPFHRSCVEFSAAYNSATPKIFRFRNPQHSKKTGRLTPPDLFHFVKFAATAKTSKRFHRLSSPGCLSLEREALTAFCTTAFQNQTAASGFHSFSESAGAETFDFRGLIRSLHFYTFLCL